MMQRQLRGGYVAGEVASLAAEITPYVSAAVGAYGGAVLAKVRDESADATISLGRRMLQRVFGSRDQGEPLPDPLGALAADPDDGDALAAVRLTIRQALTDNPALMAEVRSMLSSAPGVHQQVRARRDAYTAGRDQTIVNYPASSQPKSYLSKRQEAYEELWQVVQDAHLKMRQSLTKGFSNGISAFLTDVNSFGWKNGIYIDEADQKLALEYLFMVYEFLRIVVQHEVAKKWVASTANIPIARARPARSGLARRPAASDDVPNELESMYTAQSRADEVRFKLENRVRTVLGGLPNLRAIKRPTGGDVLAEHFATLLREHHRGNRTQQ